MRGSRKSNFTDRDAPSAKYSTCEKWPSMRLKNYGQHFSRRNSPFGVYDAGTNFTDSIFSAVLGCP